MTGYETSFNRYLDKPAPMRARTEFLADILTLQTQTDGLLEEIFGGAVCWTSTKLRVYVDTSVVGGCQEVEFSEASRGLFERFRRGELRLVLSPFTISELNNAPRRVRETLDTVPEDHVELLSPSNQVGRLAARYIEAGALGPSMRADSLHIAAATLARVDTLVSWNFKHIVNARRIRIVNAVNRRHGHSHLDIRTPEDFRDDD